MLGLPKEIVILDTEYTSWEGAQERNWSGEGEYKEIVQIGAIRLNTETFEESDSFEVVIKPVKNPLLSDYFIGLTGITQGDVEERGISLKQALAEFKSFVRDSSVYSYGLDHVLLKENGELIGIEFPLESTEFVDVRELFRDSIDTSQYISSTLPKAFDVPLLPNDHDALNDVRSIALSLKALAAITRS